MPPSVDLSLYDNLASWDDFVLQPLDDVENDVNPNHVDPRETPIEVIELDKTVAALEAEVSRLKLRRSKILSSQALIWRLPPEVLSRIFELGAHDSIHLLPVLSLVSRPWRELTLNTPVLWSYLTLDHTFGYGRCAFFMRKAKVYLERSQACKFCVDIDCRYVDNLVDFRDVMELLEPHLGRCFSFRASVMDWEDGMTIVRDNCRTLGPSLESLYLRVDPSDEDYTTFPVLSAPCPRLHTVVLEQAPLKCIADIPEDLPRLSKLHLIRDQRYSNHSSTRISISLAELSSRMGSLPMLTDLRIQAVQLRLDDEQVLLSSPILTSVKTLLSLTCNLLDSSTLSLFLESTSLPNLRRLQVQMDHACEENSLQWLQHISSFSPTPLPSLRFLDLRACNIEGPALFQFVRALRHLPQITALAVSSPPSGFIGTKLFDVLASTPTNIGDEWILPRLEAFCIQQCRDITGHELLRFVRSRYGPSIRDAADIRYLKIAQCYGVDLDILEQITVLVDVVRVV